MATPAPATTVPAPASHRAPSTTVPSSRQASEALWPGRDFKLANFLPGSVYLWACGERGEEEDSTPVSVAEVVAAWVVLLTQAVCYAGLWYVGGNRYDYGSQVFFEENNPDYSIFAIAVSMYLLLSIAAADLCGGWALILEGRGSDDFVWLTPRRIFGVFLLGTFFALVGASIRVLFYSSVENVELVLGAAAVLFIADVDEKAMVVLKNFRGQSRLFWVLEMVGLSFVLALFSVKVTGNDTAVGGVGQLAGQCELLWEDGDCSIYGWWFVLFTQPTGVTLFALLISSAVSNPGSMILVQVLKPLSWGSRLIFLTLVLCWLGHVHLWWINEFASTIFDGALAGLALCVAVFYRRELLQARADSAERLSEIDQRRRLHLFLLGTGKILLTVGIEMVRLYLFADDHNFFVSVVLPSTRALDVADACIFLAIYAWLVGGMGFLTTKTTPTTTTATAPVSTGVDEVFVDWPARSMLLGWGLCNGVWVIQYVIFREGWKFNEQYPNTIAWPVMFLLDRTFWLTWLVTTGTWLRKAVGIGNIAYWNAVTLLSWEVAGVAWAWRDALNDRTVT